MNAPLKRLAATVRDETGIALRDEQLPSLSAALARLTPASDAGDILATLSRPGDRSAVMSRLIDQLTVKETFFFRQREELEAIDWRRLHASAKASCSNRVRVWVAGCATGEEAYSVAILAREALGPGEPPVSITATDISEAALAAARTGHYGRRATRMLDSDRRARHFLNGAVAPHLRRMVSFERHNLVRDPPPVGGPFELIVCRNVLIYFDAPTVERVVAALERALAPEGLLVLGAADRLCGSIGRISPGTGKPARRRIPRPARRPPEGDRTPPVDPTAQLDVRAALLAANRGELDQAVEVTGRLLAENPLDGEANFVRGLAELGLGDAHAAVQSFRRTLYIDPDLGVAAFKLGRAYEACGDLAAAARAYERALRTLAHGEGAGAELLGGMDLADVAAACGIRLRSLAEETMQLGGNSR